MFMLKMEVNKKEGGEYKLVGSVDVPVFALNDFGIEVIANGKDDNGLPLYNDAKLQYVQDAITAAIKAAARNKLVGGSIVTKAGNKIATTVAELMESSGNSGAALALHRDFLAAFTAYLLTSGKNAKVQALYSSMVKNKASIALSTEARRTGLATQLEAFINAISESDQEKYLGIVEGLSSLCDNSADLDDSDL
jgi:hypothetical protein